MDGGFSFKGIHSSTFGVVETPESRILLPQKRRNLIDIPGRHTAVIEESGTYNSRVESILCSYVDPRLLGKEPAENLQRQCRLIAGWLNGVGELTFDYEPEMHYNAFLSNAPPLVKHLEYAQFTLEFTCNHPFAYESAVTYRFTNVTDAKTISMNVGGTIETPVKLTIKNVGTSTIKNLVLRRTSTYK